MEQFPVFDYMTERKAGGVHWFNNFIVLDKGV